MTASHAVRRDARDPIDAARSDMYRFVSRLLSAAPDAATLRQIAALDGDETAMGQAIGTLARAAGRADAARVQHEFFEIFVGVGRGELLPYASFYLTGFLNERPLATLRGDLARLGVARAEGLHDPEDHIAFLFEVMADLIDGAFEVPAGYEAAFFNTHIAPWAAQFFDDLAVAPSADFYRPLAEVGRLLIDIEARAFTLAA